MSENTIQGTDGSFEQEVVGSDVPVLVDFWAPWCGPCRMVGPALEQLADEYSGKAKVVKINVDEEKGVAAKFGIRSIPTIIIFKDGKVVETVIGARTKDDFEEMLKKNL